MLLKIRGISDLRGKFNKFRFNPTSRLQERFASRPPPTDRRLAYRSRPDRYRDDPDAAYDPEVIIPARSRRVAAVTGRLPLKLKKYQSKFLKNKSYSCLCLRSKQGFKEIASILADQ
jgi:hypothetical protein